MPGVALHQKLDTQKLSETPLNFNNLSVSGLGVVPGSLSPGKDKLFCKQVSEVG
jgi:hypothetical protein